MTFEGPSNELRKLFEEPSNESPRDPFVQNWLRAVQKSKSKNRIGAFKNPE